MSFWRIFLFFGWILLVVLGDRFCELWIPIGVLNWTYRVVRGLSAWFRCTIWFSFVLSFFVLGLSITTIYISFLLLLNSQLCELLKATHSVKKKEKPTGWFACSAEPGSPTSLSAVAGLLLVSGAGSCFLRQTHKVNHCVYSTTYRLLRWYGCQFSPFMWVSFIFCKLIYLPGSG